MSVRRAAVRLATEAPPDITWALTASGNLALRGFDVEPNDLDVKTDAAGVRALTEAFAEAVVRPVTPPGSTDADWIRSHFAVLELVGVPVELMGDAEVWDRETGQWIPTPSVEAHLDPISIDDVSVPAMTLGYERQQYAARGDDARLAQIADGPP